jgi:hypothetical protein
MSCCRPFLLVRANQARPPAVFVATARRFSYAAGRHRRIAFSSSFGQGHLESDPCALPLLTFDFDLTAVQGHDALDD